MKSWNINKEWLQSKYVTERLTTRHIALLVGCGAKTISRKLKELGIPARTRKEACDHLRNGKYVECSNKCGKVFYRKASIISKYSVFFCSWKCLKEYQSKTRVSSFSIGWRRFKEYRAWARHVKNRDTVCLLCGSSSKLVAHHIKEARLFPELVYEENNGATLCQKCHISVHKLGSQSFIKSLQEAILVE